MLLNFKNFCATLLAIITLINIQPVSAFASSENVGLFKEPLRVMLVPTDGGTEDGTRADFEPIFNALSRTTKLHFKIVVGQSYASVIEGMAAGLVDIAFVGPTLYLEAAKKGIAEPLAVAVLNGQSVYYAGFFARPDFTLNGLRDVIGHSMAFGDMNSSSSFTIQVGMLLEAGVDPTRDLSKIFLTGGHANSLNALAQGHVDLSAASFNSYQKAVNNGAINVTEVVPVASSVPIPYPPFIMATTLPEGLKTRLREGFNLVHEDPSVTPEMIRGFGGILVDRYTSEITHETFLAVKKMKDLVTSEIKSEILKKASDTR